MAVWAFALFLGGRAKGDGSVVNEEGAVRCGMVLASRQRRGEHRFVHVLVDVSEDFSREEDAWNGEAAVGSRLGLVSLAAATNAEEGRATGETSSGMLMVLDWRVCGTKVAAA